MVEQVGSRNFAAAERAELRMAAPAKVAAPAEATKREAARPPVVASTARELATSAPVDLERVARIRRAVEEGRFPISPATIADRLIALQFQWNGGGADEQA